MAASSGSLHEPDLPRDVVDRHRAIVSIMEELEAVDWYDQRVAATADPTLAAVLAHNRDEEKEHAAMMIEWLRRHDPVFDQMLRTYLFTTAPITEIEEVIESGGPVGDRAASPPSGGGAGPGGVAASAALPLGDLRGGSRARRTAGGPTAGERRS